MHQVHCFLGMIILLHSAAVTDSSYADRARLYDDLFGKQIYRKFICPAHGKPVPCEISLSIKSIINKNFKTLEIHSVFVAQWVDFRLMWDPNAYDGLVKLHINSDELWVPDIALLNSDSPLLPLSKTNAIVSHDGTVYGTYPVTLTTSCRPRNEGQNLTYECPMKFASWTYDGFLVNVTAKGQGIELYNMVTDSTQDFDIVSATGKSNVVTYTCCLEPYPDVTLILEIKERLKMSHNESESNEEPHVTSTGSGYTNHLFYITFALLYCYIY